VVDDDAAIRRTLVAELAAAGYETTEARHGAAGTTPDAVRVHVGSLRRKIEPDSSRPRYIITEPWIGYRFVAEPLPGD
jgi:DNA-binding response OmpR family regulator